MHGVPSTSVGQRPVRQSCSPAARWMCHIRCTCFNSGPPLRGSVLFATAAAAWHPQRATNISHAQTGAYLCGGASCRPGQRQQHAEGPEPGPGQPPQPAAGARGGASARPPRRWPDLAALLVPYSASSPSSSPASSAPDSSPARFCVAQVTLLLWGGSTQAMNSCACLSSSPGRSARGGLLVCVRRSGSWAEVGLAQPPGEHSRLGPSGSPLPGHASRDGK